MDLQKKNSLSYYNVAINVPLNKLFTYHFQKTLVPGTLVRAPLGPKTRQVKGVVMEEVPAPSDFKTKTLIPNPQKTNSHPQVSLHPHLLTWAQWLSRYYCHPIGQILSLFHPPLPAPLKTLSSPSDPENLESDFSLSSEQRHVFEPIKNSLESFQVHLIHGVTGSGKTEIYLQLIREVLKKDLQVLVLVPEISLTPQLESRFKKRFGTLQMTTIHSQITPRKKTDAWYDIALNRKKILIGARSALFTNFSNLGLIVIDEEHDSSFKQDEQFKYHGKDAAIMLAQIWKCPIILGSATPSLESWHHTQKGKFVYHHISQKVFKQSFPQVTLVDLKSAPRFKDDYFWYSQALHEALCRHLNKNQQVALFLNQRGRAQSIQCMSCGHKIKCPHCDITLTQHGLRDLLCHYCGHFEKFKNFCPQCQSSQLMPLGLGTEKVEEVIQAHFPNSRIIRADRDTIGNRKDMEAFVEDVENERAQILIGTQMIAKGLDFPKLSFVGVLLADVGLNVPDFRSTERIFQLICQVSGRAGRRQGLQSEVIIQTFNPQHIVFQKALHHDYKGFAELEIQEREVFNYPPFTRIASLRVQGPQIASVEKACQWVLQKAQTLKSHSNAYDQIELLGPTPAPIHKIKNTYRNLFLLKSNFLGLIQNFFAKSLIV